MVLHAERQVNELGLRLLPTIATISHWSSTRETLA